MPPHSVLQRMLRRNPLAAMAMHRDGLPRHSLQEDHHKEQVQPATLAAFLYLTPTPRIWCVVQNQGQCS